VADRIGSRHEENVFTVRQRVGREDGRTGLRAGRAATGGLLDSALERDRGSVDRIELEVRRRGVERAHPRDDHFGREPPQQDGDDSRQGAQPAGVAGVGREGDVDGKSLSRSISILTFLVAISPLINWHTSWITSLRSTEVLVNVDRLNSARIRPKTSAAEFASRIMRSAVARTFWKLAQTGYQGHTLAHHFLVSLMRFGIGFAICVVVGVPVGLLMGMHSSVRAVLDPPIETTRPIPKLALLPLFIIWFGIGELSKTIVIISALFPLISISAMQAVRAVSVRRIQAAQSLGAKPNTIFWRVILPLAKPALATLAIFTFLGSWNDFVWPLIVSNDIEMRTLPVGLTIFQGRFTTEYGITMAAAVIATIPVVIAYLFFRRRITEGIALTGLKG